MSIFSNNPYQQQQQTLAELLGGYGSLGGLLGGAMAAQQQQQGSLSQKQPLDGDIMDAMLQRPTIKFKRYARPLSFFDKLREEIDTWLKS